MTTQFSVTRRIDAPAETVWSLLTDAASYGDWNTAVISIDGTIAQGNTIRLVSVVNPKRTFTPTVTVMEPPHRMVWSDGMPLGLFTGSRTYLLREQGGGTDFSMTEVFSGPLAGLITRTIPDLTESFAACADGLKTAAEDHPA